MLKLNSGGDTEQDENMEIKTPGKRMREGYMISDKNAEGTQQ